MRDVHVNDITMKRAAATKELTLTFKEKLELAKLLDNLGVSAIEVEGIEQAKVDALRIKSLASLIKNSTLAVPVKLGAEDAELIWGALAEAKHARLQVEAAVSPAQMEYIHHMKAPAMLECVRDSVAKCATLTDDVEFIADDATRTDEAYLCSVIAAAIEAGAKTITVCDTAGAMLPEEFDQFITSLYEGVPELADVTLGISCSNALYMAEACALAGIKAGAGEVKATSYPMQVVELKKVSTTIADKQDKCQARHSVRTTQLKRSMSQIAWICEKSRPTHSPFDDSVREADESITLTADDSLDSVMECVARLGYDLNEDDAALVYEAFLRIARKKESVGSRELDAIVASAALQVPPTYALESYVINSGNLIKATANIRLRKGDEVLEAVCIGDGPIDASFLAIEQIVGRRFELDDFQIQSVTQGQEAMGESVVKLLAQGKLYSGRGISTDVIGSSIRAYINALNKIVYEEQ